MKYFIIIFFVMLSNNLEAFEINVHSKYVEQDKKFEEKLLTSPVHENILAYAINSMPEELFDIREKDRLIREIAMGTRWNDDPLDLIRKKQKDALFSFLDSCKGGKSELIDSSWDLMYRSHCGDMQFLHSMASKPDERAIETKRKIIAWIEFAYKVSTGAIPRRWRFRSLNMKMSSENANQFKNLMISSTGGRSKWTPSFLFSQSCDRDLSFFINGKWTKLKCDQQYLSENEIMNRSLGSAIHIIQDSFSKSHTKRVNGKIIQFGIYTNQNASKHKSEDKAYDTNDKNYNEPNLHNIVSSIVRLTLEDRKSSLIDNWPKVQDMLDHKVFLLNDEQTKPGEIGY